MHAAGGRRSVTLASTGMSASPLRHRWESMDMRVRARGCAPADRPPARR